MAAAYTSSLNALITHPSVDTLQKTSQSSTIQNRLNEDVFELKNNNVL